MRTTKKHRLFELKKKGAADRSAIIAAVTGPGNTEDARVEEGQSDGEPPSVGNSFVRPRGSKSARVGGAETSVKLTIHVTFVHRYLGGGDVSHILCDGRRG